MTWYCMKALFLLLLCGFFPLFVFAQQPATVDTLEGALPEIEIEAARASETEATAPFAVSVLARSPEELTLTPGTSLDEVLGTLPGVWINDRGHYALGERLSIRGMGWRAQFGVRGVQVLLDGLPLTMPDGQAILDIVDPAFIQRAEVVRGPASLFWGNGSGGVLFLSTDAAGESGGRARAMAGSYGELAEALQVSVNVGRHRFHGYVSNIGKKGYRAHSDGRFSRSAVHGTFDLGPLTSLSVTAAAALQEARNPGSLSREQIEADPRAAHPPFVETEAGKESQQVQLGATLLRQTSVGVLSTTAYGLIRDLNNPLTFAYVRLYRQASGARLSFQNETAPIAWGVGADVGAMWDDRDRWNNVGGEPGEERIEDQQETVTSTAAFAYVAPQWGALRLRLGARADRIHFTLDDNLQLEGIDASGDRTFSAISPAVGLSYEFPSVLFFASYSTAFETPTTTELTGEGRPGLDPELQPERTRGFEVGARGTAPDVRLDFDVALFYLRIRDRLMPFQTEEGGDQVFYRSAGESNHRGLEAAASWRFMPDWELGLTYTAGRLVFQGGDLDGNRIPGVPDQRLYAHLQAERQGLWARLGVEAVSAYFADDANEAENDSYALLDAHLGHAGIGVGEARLQPFLKVSNLLDTRYNGSVIINAFGGRYFEPAPGRTVQVGLNLAL